MVVRVVPYIIPADHNVVEGLPVVLGLSPASMGRRQVYSIKEECGLKKKLKFYSRQETYHRVSLIVRQLGLVDCYLGSSSGRWAVVVDNCCQSKMVDPSLPNPTVTPLGTPCTLSMCVKPQKTRGVQRRLKMLGDKKSII